MASMTPLLCTLYSNIGQNARLQGLLYGQGGSVRSFFSLFAPVCFAIVLKICCLTYKLIDLLQGLLLLNLSLHQTFGNAFVLLPSQLFQFSVFGHWICFNSNAA